MKKLYSLLFALLLITGLPTFINAAELSNEQTIEDINVRNIKTYGGSSSDNFSSMITINDGYIVVGSSSSDDYDQDDRRKGRDGSDAILVKYSSNLQVTKKITFGGRGNDAFVKIIEDSDGNYLVLGYSTSDDQDLYRQNRGEQDAFIIKYDRNLNELDRVIFGGSRYDHLYSIIQNEAGNYIAVGTSSSKDDDLKHKNINKQDGVIAEFDEDLDLLEVTTFGGTDNDILHDVIEDENNDYILVGYSTSMNLMQKDSNYGLQDAIIAKYDDNLDYIDHENFGGTKFDSFQSLLLESDGSYVVVGESSSNDENMLNLNKGGKDIVIVKYNPNLSINKMVNFGGSKDESTHQIIKDKKGNYAIPLYSLSNDGDFKDMNTGFSDIAIFKFDDEFTNIEKESFTGSSFDYLYQIDFDKDNNVVGIGSSYSNNGLFKNLNKGLIDGYIFKYDVDKYHLKVDESATVQLGTILTDKQILNLFNAEASYNGTSLKKSIIVNTQDLNINEAGAYSILFSLEYKGKTLEVEGILNVVAPKY
ncbi:hypothetical protein LJB88_03440, partial [Erysipelotrichaceae bacterium OttesenSCG-928-M19]|nr:hypothetical protein [Erysipelotrichaceae bacterium OttesenSCG-928-M19]